jgi:hypothetical protein
MNVTIQAIEHALLALLQTRQVTHARQLGFFCARMAESLSAPAQTQTQVTQTEQAGLTIEGDSDGCTQAAPPSFWWVAAAFLQTVGQSAPDRPVDTPFCKMVAQLLPWWRFQFSRHQAEAWVSLKNLSWIDLGHSLLSGCLQAWRCSLPVHRQVSIETGDLPRLNPAALNAFLELAENTLENLGFVLKNAPPDMGMNWDVTAHLTLLVVHARDLGLHSLADLIQALAHAGGFLASHTGNKPALHTSLLQGYEELTRVLHQLAAGFVKHPHLAVVEALQKTVACLAVHDLDPS